MKIKESDWGSQERELATSLVADGLLSE